MKRVLLTLLLIIGLATSFVVVQDHTVFADARAEVCAGINAASGGKDCGDTAGVNKLVGTIVDILSWIVGVLAVIMVIFAGFQYVSSGGDAGKVSNAKNTLIYAIIGLVVVAFAQTIVKFVLQKATT
jgi:hypothetical protein